MIRNILFCLLLLSPIGCSWPVGGPCDFETRLGTAQIVEWQDNKSFARFDPGQYSFTDSIIVPFSTDFKFAVLPPSEEKKGLLYPARLEIMTKGSCTPYRFTLLATEQFSHDHFFPFGKDGQLNPETTHSIKQVAAIFKELTPYWPDLTMNLCVQTRREKSAEDNLYLGDHFARIITDQLKQVGVPEIQIRAISFGEQPCPHSTFFPNEVKNGVWLKFLLTGNDPEVKEIK